MNNSPLLFLMYHAVLAEGDEGGDMDPQDRAYAVGAKTFRRQLDLIAEKWGGPVLPALDGKGETGKPGGDIKVCLTFDDGWEHHAGVALPELEKRGLKGAVFISTSQVGEKNMMSWEQVKELSDRGWKIGSHGRSHRFLRNLPEEVLREELKSSKIELEDKTGKKVDWLSFPGGRADFKAVDLARKEGYTVLFGSVPGIYRNSGESVLPRCVVKSGEDEAFRTLVENPWPTVEGLAYKAWKREVLKNLLGDKFYHFMHRLVMKFKK